MTGLLALAGLVLLLLGGMAFAAALDSLAAAALAGRPLGPALALPFRAGAAHLARQRGMTERPDALNLALAPVLYFTLALTGMSVVPLAPGVVLADIPTGIVLWGACESLTVVAVFLHGWSSNSYLALIGAYRYAAIGLPVMLLSMFVLIAAALPAESLAVTEIVEAQRGLWFVALQPPGFLLFLALGLALTLRGPFDYADPFDLAGGTKLEVSGPARAAWEAARLAMLVAVATMASAAFLGGYWGPGAPGPHWLALKVAAVVALLILMDKLIARTPAPRMLSLLWTVLLPLSFLVLAWVGAWLLWF